MKPQHKIGTKFIRRGTKRKDIETVIDILTTTNHAGEVIQLKYLVSHDFCGQSIVDRVPGATISMGEIIE